MKNGDNADQTGMLNKTPKRAPDMHAELPYISMPISYTHPAALAGLATLYGLEAPAVQSASVLEIGCAGGGNIIPLAAQFPKAKFIGIDISDSHVRAARESIEKLGLKNIEIRKADVSKVKFTKEKFDYIICHGVFSWVSKAAQKAILKICTEHLSKNGLVTISYNVLPGWHLRNVVRDLSVFHSKQSDAPQIRAEKVRAILKELAATGNEGDPYGLVLAHEAKRIAGLPASYILGEFLAADNTPYYFEEFVGMAAAHRLSYVCEGDLAASLPDSVFPKAAPRIAALAEGDAIQEQQYLDYFTGRTFRRSVLVRSQRAKNVITVPAAERMRTLYVSAALKPDTSENLAGVSAFSDERGRTVKVKDPLVRLALARLADAYPTMLSFEAMLAPLGTQKPPRDAASEARVLDVLFKLLASGRAKVSAIPFRVGRFDQATPKVWAVARSEASSGQPWVTSRTHHAVALIRGLSFLIPLIDGTRGSPELVNQLATALQTGKVKAADFMSGKAAADAKDPAPADLVLRSLAYLAVNGLLEAGTVQ